MGRNPITIVAVAAVVVLMLCVPLAASADAHEIIEGKRAATFQTSEDLQQTDVERLFPEDARIGFAETAMECLTVDSHLFDITDVSFKDMKIEKSVANKVDNKVTTVFQAYRYEMSVSFTVTAHSDGELLTELNRDTAALGELLNDNRVSAGDVIKIETELTIGGTNIEKAAFRSNSEGDFFIVDSYSETTSYAEVDSAKFTYSFSGKTESTLTISASQREHAIVSTFYDHRGVENDDVRTGTPVFIDPTVLEATYSVSMKYTDDKDVSGSHSANADGAKYLSLLGFQGEFATVTVLDSDVSPTDVCFYGLDEKYALFTDAGDASLKDDAAMRTYLQMIGEISDSYDDAYDILNDVEGGLKRDSNAVLIGILGLFILIAIIGVIYVMSNRRGRDE